MNYKYSPTCGAELIQKEIKDEGFIPFCENCSRPYFFRAKLCVLIAILNDKNEIVLTKQNHIVKDEWILISGYVKNGEMIEDTVVREVKEETGQDVTSFKYIQSYYIDHADMLMLGFVVFVEQNPFIMSDEINEIAWFTLEEASNRVMKDSIAEQRYKGWAEFPDGNIKRNTT